MTFPFSAATRTWRGESQVWAVHWSCSPCDTFKHLSQSGVWRWRSSKEGEDGDKRQPPIWTNMKSDLLESKALENPFNKTAHPEWESLWVDFDKYYVISILGKWFACFKMDYGKYYYSYKDIRKVWIFVDFDKYYIIRILGKCFACFKMDFGKYYVCTL